MYVYTYINTLHVYVYNSLQIRIMKLLIIKYNAQNVEKINLVGSMVQNQFMF